MEYELTEDEFISLVGEKAAARIQYALDHPEEAVRRPRPKRTPEN